MRILNQIKAAFGMSSSKPAAYDICPICNKSDQVIPIRYGKPNTELMERAKKGEVRLGGCMQADRPALYCKRDDKEF